MEAWGLVESLVTFLFITTAGIIAWLVNLVIANRKRMDDSMSQLKTDLAVLATKLDNHDDTKDDLKAHQDQCKEASNKVESRLTAMETKFDAIDSKIDSKFAGVDEKFRVLFEKFDKINS